MRSLDDLTHARQAVSGGYIYGLYTGEIESIRVWIHNKDDIAIRLMLEERRAGATSEVLVTGLVVSATYPPIYMCMSMGEAWDDHVVGRPYTSSCSLGWYIW